MGDVEGGNGVDPEKLAINDKENVESWDHASIYLRG